MNFITEDFTLSKDLECMSVYIPNKSSRKTESKQYKIKVYGNAESVFLSADDTCKMLKFKNIKKKLKQHVNNSDVKNLEYLVNTHSPSPEKVGKTYIAMSKKEKASLYLSASGFYQLVLFSKNRYSKYFKRFLCDEVLSKNSLLNLQLQPNACLVLK